MEPHSLLMNLRPYAPPRLRADRFTWSKLRLPMVFIFLRLPLVVSGFTGGRRHGAGRDQAPVEDQEPDAMGFAGNSFLQLLPDVSGASSRRWPRKLHIKEHLPSGPPRVFPIPRHVDIKGGCCAVLDEDVTVDLSGEAARSSSLLARAAKRATSFLRELRRDADAKQLRNHEDWKVRQIRVILNKEKPSEELQENSDWSYRLDCRLSECQVHANGVYGAVAALESTLVQLFAHGGRARFQALNITDWPDHNVRGLMVDTGRRFIPKSVLFKQVINGMALVKMNVLQLHLNDFCRFAIDLPAFPELKGTGIHTGQYSVDDIRDIVAYAQDRGVQVVPEIDIPGHASALLPLKSRGLEFCEPVAGGRTRPEEAAKIRDDPAGISRRILKSLFHETALAFGPSLRWFHVGGDEASPVGQCTEENIAGLEGHIVNYVHGNLSLTPLAWEELRFKSSESLGVLSTGGSNDTIVMAWQDSTAPRSIIQRGLRTISASLPHHYLDFSYQAHPPRNFWHPVAKDAESKVKLKGGVSALEHNGTRQRSGVLGAMNAMWTDRYSYKYQCGAAHPFWGELGGTLPNAALMFPREFDASFSKSFAGMVWPRAAVGAGSMWRFTDAISDAQVDGITSWISALLRDLIKVDTCPPGCECDELSACGKPYPVMYSENGAEPQSLEHICFKEGSRHQLGAPFQHSSDYTLIDAMRKCFWLGKECGGVSCTSMERSCRMHRMLAPSPSSSESGVEPLTRIKLTDDERCAPYSNWD